MKKKTGQGMMKWRTEERMLERSEVGLGCRREERVMSTRSDEVMKRHAVLQVLLGGDGEKEETRDEG